MRDDYEVQLRIPVAKLDEFEDWRSSMSLPEGQTIMDNSTFRFIVFCRLNDQQAMLFKLRWA
jgi:hypothetical protein